MEIKFLYKYIKIKGNLMKNNLIKSFLIMSTLLNCSLAMDDPAKSETLLPKSNIEWRLKDEYRDPYLKYVEEIRVEEFNYSTRQPYIRSIKLHYDTGRGNPCFGISVFCNGFNNDEQIESIIKWTNLKEKFEKFEHKDVIKFHNENHKYYSFDKDNSFEFHFKNNDKAYQGSLCGYQCFNLIDAKNTVNRIGDFMSFFYFENLFNDSTVDRIHDALKIWGVPFEDFRLSPDQIVDKINAQIDENTTSDIFLEIAFKEINKNKNPLRQQETCWKIAQGLLDQENTDVNTTIKFLEQIKDNTLPFYVESRSVLQKLLLSENSNEGEKFKTYKNRMATLLEVSNGSNLSIQGELEEIIVPFINNDKPGGSLPAELKNPEVSSDYILSLLDYIRKLKNGEAK